MGVQPGWIAQVSTNTKSITYPAAALLDDLIDTVESALSGMGWELFDAAAGVNARAYRAVNEDGLTYKFVVLDYNTDTQILCKLYELWNEVTHVGTNLANLSDTTQMSQRYDLILGGALYIFASARHLVLQSVTGGGIIGGNAEGPTFILEFKRDNEGDTPALNYPVSVIIHNVNLLSVTINQTSQTRSRNGATGGTVSQNGGIVCDAGLISRNSYKARINALGSARLPTDTSVWNGKSLVMLAKATYFPDSFTEGEVRGRIFNWFIVRRDTDTAIVPLSIETTFKVDEDGFPNPAGVDADFWILGTNNSMRFAIPK